MSGTKEIAERINRCRKVYSNSKKHDIVLWRQIDRFLEDMCKKFPAHKNVKEVIVKVTAIDRLYRAMLYRGRQDYHKIATGLRDSDIDKVLRQINGLLSIKNLPQVLEATKIVAGLGNPKKPRYWVFASKYLHFHKPKLFPLFDKNAKDKCNALCRRLGLTNEYLNSMNEYEAFCRQLLSLQKVLVHKTRCKASLSDLDKFLYGEQYLKRV